MAGLPLDPFALLLVLAGALAAGFTTGLAGFGTGLVAGFWFHALPAAYVPPLVALASVAGQLMGVAAVRRAVDRRRLAPFLIGGLLGVPLGVLALKATAPDLLRLAVGLFLVAYAAYQLGPFGRLTVGAWGGRPADGAVGLGGGFLGGFAGLSGPLPLIWLQLRGGPSQAQRAVYQPFNLIVLLLASAAMAAGGLIGRELLLLAGLALPVTLLGAWLGLRAYRRIGEAGFRRLVLVLLLLSGAVLSLQTSLESLSAPSGQ